MQNVQVSKFKIKVAISSRSLVDITGARYLMSHILIFVNLLSGHENLIDILTFMLIGRVALNGISGVYAA